MIKPITDIHDAIVIYFELVSARLRFKEFVLIACFFDGPL